MAPRSTQRGRKLRAKNPDALASSAMAAMAGALMLSRTGSAPRRRIEASVILARWRSHALVSTDERHARGDGCLPCDRREPRRLRFLLDAGTSSLARRGGAF